MRFTTGYGCAKPTWYVPGQNTQEETLRALLERNATRDTWMSIEEMARELRMKEASVGSRLRDLRAAGRVIKRKSFKTKAGNVFKYRME